MITTKDEIGLLHSLLQHRDKWYIDVICPDIDEFMDIGELAKEEADEKLSKMSKGALYSRFKKWEKSDKIMGVNEDYYRAFLGDLVYDLGFASLKGNDRDLYNESIILKIHFI